MAGVTGAATHENPVGSLGPEVVAERNPRRGRSKTGETGGVTSGSRSGEIWADFGYCFKMEHISIRHRITGKCCFLYCIWPIYGNIEKGRTNLATKTRGAGRSVKPGAAGASATCALLIVDSSILPMDVKASSYGVELC